MYRHDSISVNRWTSRKSNPHAGEPKFRMPNGRSITYKSLSRRVSAYRGRTTVLLYPGRVVEYLKKLRSTMTPAQWQQYELYHRSTAGEDPAGYIDLAWQRPSAKVIKAMLVTDLLKAFEDMQSIPHDTKQEMEVAA